MFRNAIQWVGHGTKWALLVLFFAGSASAQPAPKKNSSEPKREIVVVIKSLVVADKKADGRVWDFWAVEPDPQITIIRSDEENEKKLWEMQAEILKLEGEINTLRSTQRSSENPSKLDDSKNSPKPSNPTKPPMKTETPPMKMDPIQTQKQIQKLQMALDQRKKELEDFHKKHRLWFVTPMVKDSYKAQFNLESIHVTKGDEVKINVLDIDIAFHDDIGSTTIKIDDKMIKDGKVDLSFGQVKSLVLEFKRIGAK